MNPLFNCPYCGCYLKYHSYTKTWYSKSCPDRCTMKYGQNFFGTELQDERDFVLAYIRFETAHFFMDVYFEKGFYPGLTYVYSHNEIQRRGTAMPILKLPNSRIDTAFLENIEKNDRFINVGIRQWLRDLDDKLQTLALFV